MPIATVIIPTYNRSGLVMQAVNSALNQSLADIEIIVVDDGSEDDTGDVISKCEDPRLRYLRKENGGVSSARNVGIDNARGTYVFFLDDDDEWYDNHLETMVHALEENRNHGAVYCPWGPRDCPIDSLNTNRPSGDIAKAYFNKTIIHIIAFGIRRDALEGVRFDASLKIAEDSDFLLRVSLRTSFLFVATTCAIHNVTEVSLTSNFDESRVRSLERFYFRLGGDKVVSKKDAMAKLSKSCRAVAKHYAREGMARAARWYYKKAIIYRPSDLRNYAPMIKECVKSLTAEQWTPPGQLPDIVCETRPSQG